ncbi:peptide MFS transporter [Mycobacterium shigaense]|uniref:peptide MFS transporter n=1 Tax=Mycobacterium shigaense TaxID=722731 RepID=UPI000E58E33F|nr:oligopeptide:H+ symporter [Mycobacterium shigaense]
MTTRLDPTEARSDREPQFFGHPRQLMTPVSVEVWERFSFYGMRAILALYLLTPTAQGGMGLPTAAALSLTAIYSASAYLTSVLGGWIADRFIGARKTVLSGGLIIMCGHIILAIPTTTLFYFGLTAVVLGTGLLKPNIASLVGALYSPEDQRRDSGFCLFYMGINIGGFVAPLVCGWLGQNINYHAGFLAAAIGMGIGVAYFIVNFRALPDVGPRTHDSAAVLVHPAKPAGIGATGYSAAAVVFVVTATSVVTGGGLQGAINAISAATFTIPVAVMLVMMRSARVTSAERSHLKAYVPLFLTSVAFWMMFEQGSTVLSELAADRVATNLFGVGFPSSWFLSINSLAIIIFAPVIAAVWIKLRHRNPGAATRMGTGTLVGGVTFAAVPLALATAGHGGLISPVWLIGIYLVQAVAELAVSPVGIAETTRLAPYAYANQTMGFWYLSMAAGAGLGAQMVKLSTVIPTDYYYFLLAVIGVGVGAAVLTLRGRIGRLSAA